MNIIIPHASISKMCDEIMIFHSLHPSDAIYCHKSHWYRYECCQMTHYLNQCWFTVSEVLWHSFAILQGISNMLCTKICLKFPYPKLQSHLPEAHGFVGTVFLHALEFYSERLWGAGLRSVNPIERWHENPAKVLAQAVFSQHLDCGIHHSEFSPEGFFALIPHPVARWAKTTS